MEEFSLIEMEMVNWLQVALRMKAPGPKAMA